MWRELNEADYVPRGRISVAELGNLASVAGLILSGLAAIFAHRALTEVYALVRRQVLKTDVKLDDVLSELKKL